MYRHCNHNRVYLLGILLLIPGQLIAEDLTPEIRLERGEFKSRQQQGSNALLKGRRWLEQQQRYDGSWQSKTYASLESSIAASALVMSTLVEITPPGVAQDDSIRRGLNHLTSKLNQGEIWKSVEAESNYPLYSISLMLTTLNQVKPDTTANQRLRESLSQALLRRQQILEPSHRSGEDVAGGWKPGSELFQQGSAANPANVSVTYFTLAALSGAGKLPRQNRIAALDYLQHSQIPAGALGAGGFMFTMMADHPLNKAGWNRSQDGTLNGISYLSATCDGISALLACDITSDDQRIRSALTVLPQLSRSRLAEIPLKAEGSYQKLDALFFYEAAATARVWKQLRGEGVENQFLNSRCNEILQTLIVKQHADGHWENPLPWMREDDPLIATAFALQAIHRRLARAE